MLLLRGPFHINRSQDTIRESNRADYCRLERWKRKSIPLGQPSSSQNAGADQKHSLAPSVHIKSVSYSPFIRLLDISSQASVAQASVLGRVAQTWIFRSAACPRRIKKKPRTSTVGPRYLLEHDKSPRSEKP